MALAGAGKELNEAARPWLRQGARCGRGAPGMWLGKGRALGRGRAGGSPNPAGGSPALLGGILPPPPVGLACRHPALCAKTAVPAGPWCWTPCAAGLCGRSQSCPQRKPVNQGSFQRLAIPTIRYIYIRAFFFFLFPICCFHRRIKRAPILPCSEEHARPLFSNTKSGSGKVYF